MAFDNYPHALEFVSECYKTKKTCDKTVYAYPSLTQFPPEFYETQKMCDKVAHRCFLYLILFLINKKLKSYVT